MKLIGSSKALRSPEFHKRKVWESRLKVALLTILVLALLAAPIFVLRSSHLMISKIEIKGSEVTKDAEIQEIVSKHLAGAYLHVIPRSSALLYPKTAIESEILGMEARISKVDVSLTGTRSLSVEVTERKPHALYCSDSCFFLDDTGYIFAPAPNFSHDVYVVYATEPVLESPIRTQLFDAEELKRLEGFLAFMRGLSVKPDVLTRIGDEYQLTQAAGPVLKWKTNQDFGVLAVNLESFIENGGFKIADIDRMLYIDLRFGNKVFYKFKTDQAAE